MNNKIILGYWPVKGIAQVPRYLLEYTGLSYVDKFYTSDEEWAQTKQSGEFDFPNLPYIIDGNFKLTESSAISRWIPVRAKNSNLLGGDEYDQFQVQMLSGVLVDVAQSFFTIVFAPKDSFEATKAAELAKMELKFGYLSKYLGEKDWLLGYITIADFQAAHMLDVFSKIDGNFLNKWKNLEDLQARFFNLDPIKKYVESSKNPKLFVPPELSSWGY